MTDTLNQKTAQETPAISNGFPEGAAPDPPNDGGGAVTSPSWKNDSAADRNPEAREAIEGLLDVAAKQELGYEDFGGNEVAQEPQARFGQKVEEPGRQSDEDQAPDDTEVSVDQEEPAAPLIDEALRRDAEAVGFRPDEIDRYTPEMLQVVVQDRQRRIVEQHNLAAQQAAEQTASTSEPEPPPEFDPPDKRTDEEIEEAFGPEAAQQIIAGRDALNAQAKATYDLQRQLESNNRDTQQAQAEAQQQVRVSQFEAAIVNLPDELKAFTGGGVPFGQLKRGSPETKAVVDIVARAELLEAGYIHYGKQPPPLGQLVLDAAQTILAPRVQEQAKTTEALEKRSSQALTRGKSGTKKVSGKDPKAEAAKEIAKNLGVSNDYDPRNH